MGTRLTYSSSSHSRLPVPTSCSPSLLPSFPPSLIPLSCSFLIAFTALLISQIGLIDWIWFLWTEQLYWVAFSLMDRSVWVFVTHMCVLGMIKENFLSSFLLLYKPAAIHLPGIPADRSSPTQTHHRLHKVLVTSPSEWMFYYGWCIHSEESVSCGDTLSEATLKC